MVVFCGLDGVLVCVSVVSGVYQRLLHVALRFAVDQNAFFGSESVIRLSCKRRRLVVAAPLPRQGRHRDFFSLPHGFHEASNQIGNAGESAKPPGIVALILGARSLPDWR